MSASAVPPADDPEILAERAFLVAARAALRRMSAAARPVGGSEDNDDFAVNLLYRQARARRAEALIDLPDVPLFFGRLDYDPGTVYATDPADGPAATQAP